MENETNTSATSTTQILCVRKHCWGIFLRYLHSVIWQYYALQFVHPIASLKSYHVTIQQTPVSDLPTEWKLYRILPQVIWWIIDLILDYRLMPWSSEKAWHLLETELTSGCLETIQYHMIQGDGHEQLLCYVGKQRHLTGKQTESDHPQAKQHTST
jgi:hypothetical protein